MHWLVIGETEFRHGFNFYADGSDKLAVLLANAAASI
jgi:hypothetical protein